MDARSDSYRPYRPEEYPDVVVEIDGRFLDGSLRAWSRRDGGWWGHVTYSRDGQNFLDTLPAARVTQVPSCPWYRGVSRCLHECGRRALLDGESKGRVRD